MSADRPVLVLHGGTGHGVDTTELARRRRRLRAVCASVYRDLQTRSARESVVHAVQQLEDDPLFNAGTGSSLQRDGRARMSAAVMDGSRHRFAAVLNIERVRNPILVAQALLAREDRIVAGAEAIHVARSLGYRAWNPITAASRTRWRQRLDTGHGTVGAVALDRKGCLAAATSTGGKGFEWPGRVSDSGLPVGTYANAQVAISCTGIGEDILEEALAVRIAQRLADGVSLLRAFRLTFQELTLRHRRAGAIGLDARGRLMWQTTAPLLLAIAKTPSQRLESF